MRGDRLSLGIIPRCYEWAIFKFVISSSESFLIMLMGNGISFSITAMLSCVECLNDLVVIISNVY